MVTVPFALLPLIATFVVRHLTGAELVVNPQELLFFTFMICAITVGDLIEIIGSGNSTSFLVLILAVFIMGASWCILLYAMVSYRALQPNAPVSGTVMLSNSKILAVTFFILGTLVQLAYAKWEDRLWRSQIR